MSTFTHHSMMHGQTYAGQDVAGWLAQEKLDGWRALWTGAKLVTRQGQDYCAPDWFTRGLPETPLDCELYLGRGRFNEICKMAWNKESKLWQQARLVVFDVPTAKGGIVERLMAAPVMKDWCHIVGLMPVTSLLRFHLGALLASGGEGYMLREPSAPYVAGRTNKLLKLKK